MNQASRHITVLTCLLGVTACHPSRPRQTPPPAQVLKKSTGIDLAEAPVPPPPPPPSPRMQLADAGSPSCAAGVAGGGVAGAGMAVAGSATAPGLPQGRPAFHTEAYASFEDNPFQDVAQQPLATFGADVDTASYSNLRRFVTRGSLPPRGAVRLEELVNAFPYRYTPPTGEAPIAVHTALADCPWAPGHQILRIGIQGRTYTRERLPARNLVFLVDVSGSMATDTKLPLVKRGLSHLVGQLRPEDHVSLVVYAGSSGLVLPPTSGAHKGRILAALDQLEAGGATQGAAGIQLAYATARRHFQKGAINRVILCTDGDFNVGVTSQSELVDLITREKASGVFLTVLGFGMGNYKDSTLELLADKGDGHYAYLDTEREARRVFADGGATLVTIAKDVKLQVEFNPAKVKGYRLLGYENRVLAAQDFHNDRKDAGDMGAGHSVTALFELVPADRPLPAPAVDPLRYQTVLPGPLATSDELATVKFRYKAPDAGDSRLLSHGVRPEVAATPDPDFHFALSLATLGLLLRESPHKGQATWSLAESLALAGLAEDPGGERRAHILLLAQARRLWEARRGE